MPRPHHIKHVKSLLRDGGTLTAGRMAGEMECSERTVRRCVDHLRDVEGWPVEAGKQGYFLREASRMETQITSHQEIAALAMAYESLRMIGGTELGVQIRAEVAKACRYAGDLGEVVICFGQLALLVFNCRGSGARGAENLRIAEDFRSGDEASPEWVCGARV